MVATELEVREAVLAAAAGEPLEARLALDGFVREWTTPGVDAIARWSSWESVGQRAMIEDVVAEELQASIGEGWWFTPLASAAPADKAILLDTYQLWKF